MAVSQTIFRTFVQIPVISLCVLSLVACGGGNSGDSGDQDTTPRGYIEIEKMQTPDYCRTSSLECTLSMGGAVFNQYYVNGRSGVCRFEPPLDLPGPVGVSVYWTNKATGDTGNANVRWTREISPWPPRTNYCSAIWDAQDIPLSVGENTLTITARGNSGRTVSIDHTVVMLGTDWSEPERIDNNGWRPNAPQVAVDSNGNAIAIWERGWTGQIRSSTYSPGSGWDLNKRVSNKYARGSDPQIAFDSTGNAIALWSELEGSSYRSVWASRYTRDFGWDSPVLIETDEQGNARDAQIVIDKAGNATAVWHQSDGIRRDIWSNRYTLGIGWGTAEKIESNDNDALDPKAALDAIGNVLVVWKQADSIWSNRYTMGTGWGIANEIVSGSGVSCRPEVAVDSFGNAIAVWSSFDGVEKIIWANRYVFGVGWGTANTIANAACPQVAINPDGDAMVVWLQGNSSQTEIWSKRFTAVIGWEATEQIATGLQTVANLQVATDANGGATAVWASVNAVWASVNYNQYVEGIGWGSPREIKKIYLEGPSSNGRPQIASNSNGKAVIVWLQESHVWASLFEG